MPGFGDFLWLLCFVCVFSGFVFVFVHVWGFCGFFILCVFFVVSVRGFCVLLCLSLSGFMWSFCGVLGARGDFSPFKMPQ